MKISVHRLLGAPLFVTLGIAMLVPSVAMIGSGSVTPTATSSIAMGLATIFLGVLCFLEPPVAARVHGAGGDDAALKALGSNSLRYGLLLLVCALSIASFVLSRPL